MLQENNMGSIDVIHISEATDVFQRLWSMTTDVTDADMKALWRYVVLIYFRASRQKLEVWSF